MFQTFLYAAAIFGVVAFIVLLIMVIFFYAKVRNYKKSMLLRAATKTFNEEPYAPAITLEACDKDAFLTSDFRTACHEFESARFKEIGTYAIRELPIRLLAYEHDDFQVIVHEHARGFSWTEIVTNYSDGDYVVVSNCEYGQSLELPDFCEKYFYEDVHGMALFKRAQEHREDNEILSIEPEAFTNHYQTRYRREITWRAQTNISAYEAAKIGEASGVFLDPQEMADEAYEKSLVRSQEMGQAVIEKYLKGSDITALQWEKRRARILVVHNCLTYEDLFDSFVDFPVFGYEMDEEIRKRFDQGEEPVLIFESMNQRLDGDDRYEVIFRTHEPFPALIYLSSPNLFKYQSEDETDLEDGP